MRKGWLKFGCFLTGYNYEILRNSSEASAKVVKKNTGAVLIVCILWGFIGYMFADRYMQLELIGSLVAASIMIFIVIQIEKQIILNVDNNNWIKGFRIALALIMAILGSVIIDQMIFKDDLDLAKEQVLGQRVNQALPIKVTEINEEIIRIDSIISTKEKERNNLIAEVTKNPTIKLPSYETKRIPGKTEKILVDENGLTTTVEVDTIFTQRTYTSTSQENPKATMIPQIDEQLADLSIKRENYTNRKIGIRESLEKEFRSKTGFLDELELMKNILLGSKVAMVVWAIWFLFLVFLELMVVSSKLGKSVDNDYDVAVKHHRNVRIQAINQLSQDNRKPNYSI